MTLPRLTIESRSVVTFSQRLHHITFEGLANFLHQVEVREHGSTETGALVD